MFPQAALTTVNADKLMELLRPANVYAGTMNLSGRTLNPNPSTVGDTLYKVTDVDGKLRLLKALFDTVRFKNKIQFPALSGPSDDLLVRGEQRLYVLPYETVVSMRPPTQIGTAPQTCAQLSSRARAGLQ